MKLETNEIETITNVDQNPNESSLNKRKNTNHADDTKECRKKNSPSFDLNTKTISFGNDDKTISIDVYAVSYHLENTELLKTYYLASLTPNKNLLTKRLSILSHTV